MKNIKQLCLFLAVNLLVLGSVHATISGGGSFSFSSGNGFRYITNDQNISSGHLVIDGETIILDNINSKLRASGTGSITIKNSQIKLDTDVTKKRREKGPLNYGLSNSSTSFLRLKEDTLVLVGPFTERKNIMLSEVSGGSAVIEAEASKEMFVYTQDGAILENASFKGINTWEVYGQPSVLYNVLVQDTNYGYLNWESPRLDFIGLSVFNVARSDAWFGGGWGNPGNVSAYHWNNKNFNNQNICFSTNLNRYFEGYTASLELKNQQTLTPISDALVVYRDDRTNIGGSRAEIARYATNAAGRLVGTHDTKTNTAGASQERPTLFLLTAQSNFSQSTYSSVPNCRGTDNGLAYGIDTISPEVEIRSYEYLLDGFKAGQVYNISHEVGKIKSNETVEEYSAVLMVADTGISVNKSTALAYTAINNLDEFYNRAKAEWRDNDFFPLVSFAGKVLDLNNVNLVLDNTAATVYSYNATTNTITIKSNALQAGTKFDKIKTTGLITFVNGSTLGTAILQDAVGTTGNIVVNGLNNASVLVYDDSSTAKTTVYYSASETGAVSVPFHKTTSTVYKIIVRKPGFSEVNLTINPSTGGRFLFPITQFRALTIEGTPIYQGSGDTTKISLDFANKKVNIGDFTIPAQELYDTLQDYEMTENGMKYVRIANYNGDDKVLLLNGYQVRNRDGSATIPGVNAFVFAETGGVLDASNGSVQFLSSNTATVDRQEQIVKMLEKMQGSVWNSSAEEYTTAQVNLTNMAGAGFDPTKHGLSRQIQEMLDAGILNFNTMKDLLQ